MMIWCYRGDGHGDAAWEMYEQADASKLELAYSNRNNNNSGDGTVILQKGQSTYICDINTMQQTNLDTGFSRDIHRGWPDVPPEEAETENDGGDSDEDNEEEEDDMANDEDYNSDDTATAAKKRKRMEELFDSPDSPEMKAAAPKAFLCPLSMEIMQDPVITLCGSTYERKMMEEWLQSHSTDPLTNDNLSGRHRKQLIPNRALRDAIQQWREQYNRKHQTKRQKQDDSKPSPVEDSKPSPVEDSKPFPVEDSKPSAIAIDNSGPSPMDDDDDDDATVDPAVDAATRAPASPSLAALAAAAAAVATENPTTTTAASTAFTEEACDGDNDLDIDDLQEGEERIVCGFSTGMDYTVKLLRGIYSCSCPAWRYAGGPIDNRSCKHLRQVRGEAAEQARLFQNSIPHRAAAASASSSSSTKQPDPNALQGQVICFTGALGTMTRVQAQALARRAGAIVTQSVTRSTTVLVVGKRPGVKLSNSDASPHCDTWTEDAFLAATGATEEDVSVSATSSPSRTGTRSPVRGSRSPARGAVAGGHRLGGAAVAMATGAQGDVNGSVPPRIMLANKFDDKKDDPTGWLLSEKLDGMRAFWDGHTGKLWSRQGHIIHTPDWWTAAFPRDMYLDGELWLGRGQFQQCMSIVRRQNRPQAWDQITYLVFDAPDDVDATGVPNSNPKGYETRHETATEAIADAAKKAATGTKSYAKVHPYEICQGQAHLQRKMAEVEAVDGEGLMLRRPRSHYRGGRSSDLLKVKSAHDDEAVVTGHDAGRGRHSGRVGALQVVNRNGKRFKVGSGLTDEERENPPAVGSVITYRYNELTNAGVPRFPVFVRIRPDVQPSDITNS